MKVLINRLKNAAIRKIITFSQRMNFPMRNTRDKTQSRFLIISTTGIGDTLWGTPSIHALRETFPECYISVLTNPVGFEILKENPDINNLYIFKRGLAGYFKLPGLLKQLKKKNIDTAFIFHASDRILWPICFFSGAAEIIGFKGQNKGLDFILTRTVNLQNNIHGIESRLRLVEEIKAATSKRAISFYLTDKEREKAERFLQGKGINKHSLLIGLHPGAQKPFKCWPAKRFIEAGNILVKSFGCKVIVTGDSNEKAIADDIASKIKDAVSTAGKLSLRETAAVIERMSLFISNDTGPMHISFALRTPTVALFSPTDPKLCGPYHAEGVGIIKKLKTCDPCIAKKCNKPTCMEQITVEEVVTKAESLLRKGDKILHETEQFSA
jgi:lipopolysaccharide heptosyltransferase II